VDAERFIRRRGARLALAVFFIGSAGWAFLPYLTHRIGASAFVNSTLVRMTAPFAGRLSLALIGGLQIFAPVTYQPLASRVLSSFQSFRILPTVLTTLIRPFGHAFRVTPKGRDARRSNYERGIFWSSAVLMFLTIGGLVVNSVPEFRVIDQTTLIPVMAIWE